MCNSVRLTAQDEHDLEMKKKAAPVGSESPTDIGSPHLPPIPTVGSIQAGHYKVYLHLESCFNDVAMHNH